MTKYFFLGLSALFLLTNCKKLNKLTQFNIEYDETIVIPSSTGISLPFIVITPETATNSESTFEVNDTRKELIQSIILTELSLTLDSPTSGNFNFLKTINVFMNAEGLSEVCLASKQNMTNTNSKKISLDVSGADLQEYIKKDKFKLRVETVTDEAISQDHSINLHSVFFVDAKLKK